MSIAVKISNELARSAKINSIIFKRSLAGQIEFWATIGKIAEENEDLPFSFIKKILVGKRQAKNQDLTPYEFNQ
ncbi:MAG: hypothetical protein RAP70_05655 [Candidatus Celaenobacter antarcticus]|nr:hypothetical protein [Candidatus Celaenobacter antarcticus]